MSSSRNSLSFPGFHFIWFIYILSFLMGLTKTDLVVYLMLLQEWLSLANFCILTRSGSTIYLSSFLQHLCYSLYICISIFFSPPLWFTYSVHYNLCCSLRCFAFLFYSCFLCYYLHSHSTCSISSVQGFCLFIVFVWTPTIEERIFNTSLLSLRKCLHGDRPAIGQSYLK